MTASDFFSDLLENFKERIRNPLLIAFAISWSVSNWEVVIVLFKFNGSANDVILNLRLLNHNAWELFWRPFLFSIGYVALAPFIAFAFQWLSKWPKQWISELSHDREMNSLGNKVKRKQEQIKLEKAESEFNEIKELNEKIEQLNAEVETHKNLSENLHSEIDTYEEKYSDINNELLTVQKEVKILLNEKKADEILIQELQDRNNNLKSVLIKTNNVVSKLQIEILNMFDDLNHLFKHSGINSNEYLKNMNTVKKSLSDLKESVSKFSDFSE